MDKIEFIKAVRQFIADGNTEDALELFRSKIVNYDPSILTDATILESRFQNAKSDFVMKGILPREEYDRTVAQVNFALLELLEKIEKTTVLQTKVSKNKTSGRILHNIPGTMPLGRESRCIVRIAYDDDILTQDFQLTKDTVIQSVRIAEVMGVELLDFNETPAFQIRTITEEEQFVDRDEYTQWIFQVKPILAGKFPLTLKVAVIEEIAGRERKRDIVLEKDVFIISQQTDQSTVPVIETTRPNHLAFEETNILLNSKESEQTTVVPQTTASKRSMTGIVSALATVVLAITGLMIYQTGSVNESTSVVFQEMDSTNMINLPQIQPEIAAQTKASVDSVFQEQIPVYSNTDQSASPDELASPNLDDDAFKDIKVGSGTPAAQNKIRTAMPKNRKSQIEDGNESAESNPSTPPLANDMRTYKVNILLKEEMKNADILVNGQKPLTVKKNESGTAHYIEFKSNKRLQTVTFIKQNASCQVENIDLSNGVKSIEPCSFTKKSDN